MTPELADLHALEQTLWDTRTRFDRTLMDATFAEDFSEFGRSGRRYTRDQVLPGEADSQDIDATLHRFAVRPLSDDLALATYVSEVQYAETEWANRSSIWDRASGRWRLRFHQGTPTEPLR